LISLARKEERVFPVRVSGQLRAECTRTPPGPDFFRSLRAEIEARGGAVVSETGASLVFTNPVSSSALRSNWSLFSGVTGGEVRLIPEAPLFTIHYYFSMRRLVLIGIFLAACALVLGPPELVLAVAVLVGINYLVAWLRLSSTFRDWARRAPGVFLR
jgi:hypothetical protein